MGRYFVCVFLCLTLGLAPFSPEPHLVQKVRWVVDGAEGMRAIDWFDLVLHASPWLALAAMAVRDLIRVGISKTSA